MNRRFFEGFNHSQHSFTIKAGSVNTTILHVTVLKLTLQLCDKQLADHPSINKTQNHYIPVCLSNALREIYSGDDKIYCRLNVGRIQDITRMIHFSDSAFSKITLVRIVLKFIVYYIEPFQASVSVNQIYKQILTMKLISWMYLKLRFYMNLMPNRLW